MNMSIRQFEPNIGNKIMCVFVCVKSNLHNSIDANNEIIYF